MIDPTETQTQRTDYSTAAETARLNEQFTYHRPFGDQPARYMSIRETAKVLAHIIDRCCPPSREKALALTNLQLTVMLANASIAINEKEPAAPPMLPPEAVL